MPMYRVSFTVTTTIRGECDIKAKSEEDANDTAEDKITELIDVHDKAVRAHYSHQHMVLEDSPKDPIDWSTEDAVDNADLGTIEIEEVTEL